MHASFQLTTLDRTPWQDVQASLQDALAGRALEKLLSPATLILHDLLDGMLKTLHLRIFREVFESQAGLSFDESDEQIEPLYRAELLEHGYQNISRVCVETGRHVAIEFPSGGDTLANIRLPFAWQASALHTGRLIDALGFRLDTPQEGQGQWVRVRVGGGAEPPAGAATLIDPADAGNSLMGIFHRLDYGLMHLAATGEILAVSPSLIRLLHLESDPNRALQLAEAIPLAFFNDIVWGLTLDGGGGTFENYRIRLPLHGGDGASILFNVSGHRDDASGMVISLWQKVSRDEGAKFAEGSMINEARIRNITRNYVPQMVERKAREAVLLGKTSLGNEERKLAVLFCDIVGFTAFTETHAGSESVIDTLNTILRRVSLSVKHHRGMIDKFMGDCIMALFDDPADAIRAALDMQSHAEDINTLRGEAGQQILKLRIGIHWGEVFIGNVGTPERLDWTAIGDVVNTASRIEQACPPGTVLVSRTMRDQVKQQGADGFGFGPVISLQVKGKRDALEACEATLLPKGGAPQA